MNFCAMSLRRSWWALEGFSSFAAYSGGQFGVRSHFRTTKKEKKQTVSIGSTKLVPNTERLIPASDMFICATQRTKCFKIPQLGSEVHVKASSETAGEPLLICGS